MKSQILKNLDCLMCSAADPNELKRFFDFAENNGTLFLNDTKQFTNHKAEVYDSECIAYLIGDLLFTKTSNGRKIEYDIATNKVTNSDFINMQTYKENGSIYGKFKSLQTWVLVEEYGDFCNGHIKGFAKISKPVFGLFYVFDYWNLGMSMDIILPIRAKDENSTKYQCYTDLKTKTIGINNCGFSHIIETWDYKPSFKELKQAFKKSNYYNIQL